MTNPIDKAQLRALAEVATQGEGQHVYTNPRDDNNWRANEQWHRAASPATIIALLDEVEALDTENDLLRQHAAKQINDATLLTGINIGNGSMDIGMQGGAARLLAESFFDQFIESGAVNYLEVRFDSPEKMPGKSMVVTLQLVDGLTPAQKIAELKAQVEALRADAALGRIAMRFVDRAGDVHPGIDDAETICADFHAAMCKDLDSRAITRAAASIGAAGGGGEHG